MGVRRTFCDPMVPRHMSKSLPVQSLVRPRALPAMVLMSSALVSSCACEKNVSIDAWCSDADDRCEGLRSFEPALQKLALQCQRQTFPTKILLSTCGDTTAIIDGDGYVGRSLTYDSKGRLVGGKYYSDTGVNRCDAPSGGKPLAADDSCSICSICSGEGYVDDACDPKLGGGLVDSCLDVAPASFEGECRNCACSACYPIPIALATESDAGSGGQWLLSDFEDCALEQCKVCDEEIIRQPR